MREVKTPKATGIIRRIDDLGRVIIPKEIRRTLGIRVGDPLEIFTDGEVILIQGGYTMYNSKEEAMREEAREAIIEALSDGYAGYYSDLHHEIFNTSYYIIGTCQAKQALEEYGVFDAIGKVQEYEKNNFGEVYTDLGNPEKVINMLYYIIGEEVLFEMIDSAKTLDENWDNRANEETNAKILAELDA